MILFSKRFYVETALETIEFKPILNLTLPRSIDMKFEKSSYVPTKFGTFSKALLKCVWSANEFLPPDVIGYFNVSLQNFRLRFDVLELSYVKTTEYGLAQNLIWES